jgi:hypothetical protein
MYPAYLLLMLATLIVAPPLVAFYVAFAIPIPAWMNTPDDPDIETQGLYEPQVKWVRDRLGQDWKTVYWLGIRNQLNGLFYRLAMKAPAASVLHYSGAYPRTKDPFLAGSCLVTCVVDLHEFWEWTAVGRWSASKCWQLRFGYKLAEMSFPGPVLPVFQIRPFITVDSTT